MTDLRREQQCRHDNCDSEAEWTLLLCFRDAAGNEYKAPTTVKVCQRHVDSAARFALSDQNWTRLARTMTEAGLPMPLFNSATPVMMPVSAPVPTH